MRHEEGTGTEGKAAERAAAMFLHAGHGAVDVEGGEDASHTVAAMQQRLVRGCVSRQRGGPSQYGNTMVRK